MTEQVWILDDDSSIRWVVERALSSVNISCRSFAAAESLWQALEFEQPAVIISDIRMPNTDGITLLHRLQKHYSEIPVIIMTAHSDLDSAVNAYQAGAFEYLPKPFDIDEAIALVEKALVHSSEQNLHVMPTNALLSTPEIIGEAPSMQEVFRAIGRLSNSSMSVLINGQSGTGKELVAGALHKHSPRKEQAFIAINMAAIPTDLIESELFGHEKGAFTGAAAVRKGRFEQADRGTLFLDEIGDMPIDVQTRLLRVLSDGQFYRVGGHSPIQVDVRIIAATHQNLENLVATGQFREDLFHRLNVIRLHLPPLSKRREDIPQLANYFIAKAAKEMAIEVKVLNPETIATLSNLPWPGNVRQLENICRWLTVMATGQEILPQDLPPELIGNESPMELCSQAAEDWQVLLTQLLIQKLQAGEHNILVEITHQLERIALQTALKHTAGHKQQAAKQLGWGRNTLTRKLKELLPHSYL